MTCLVQDIDSTHSWHAGQNIFSRTRTINHEALVKATWRLKLAVLAAVPLGESPLALCLIESMCDNTSQNVPLVQGLPGVVREAVSRKVGLLSTNACLLCVAAMPNRQHGCLGHEAARRGNIPVLVRSPWPAARTRHCISMAHRMDGGCACERVG